MKFLRCFFSLLLLQNALSQSEALSNGGGFIGVNGTQIMLDGSPFYGNGFNAHWLTYMAADPPQRGKISTLFEAAKAHGLTMARTWAFRDGGDDRPLQYSPGSYNEQVFQGLDFVISEAGKYGIKLILSLVNNYDQFGGKKQYVDWARNQSLSISSDDGFFTNSLVKGYYKNHIHTVLTRHNTITGVSYKDDPTIMAWELMNEPRCSSDPSGNTIQAWITEMASYVKSIDSNHLLEIGLEGFYGPAYAERQQFNPSFQVGTDFISNNQIPGIDFATVHSYPDQWLPGSDEQTQDNFLQRWMKTHIQDAQTILKKPVLFAEFGKSTKSAGSTQRDQLFNQVYSAVYSSARGGGAALGGMFWQLFSEGMDSFRDGYEVIFDENKSTAEIIAKQSHRLNRIRKMYVRLRKLKKWKKARGNGDDRKGN